MTEDKNTKATHIEVPDSVGPAIKKQAGGRPTKYRPEFCDALMDHMEAGGSIEGFGGYLAQVHGREFAIHKSTIYEWAETYPEFSDAKKAGESMATFLIEKIALDGMQGRIENFNATMTIFNLKNRCNYRDVREITGANGGSLKFESLTPAELKLEIETTAKRLAILNEPKLIDDDENNNEEESE